ncbi:MAG: MarR family transcriptional regulator [Flavobacteriia bacterium]|nr:MAG: MarR family transcriptional regulator [Flavobacteriia bacterium]
MENINFEKTVLPQIGITAKLAGFYITDHFHENNIDLSKEQWLILLRLNEKDGRVQNDLALITNRSKTSLTRLINTIEKKGFVHRVHSKEDKRINYIYLTEKGKEIFERSLPILQNLIKRLQEGIDPEDLKNTIKVLNKIQKNITKHHLNIN